MSVTSNLISITFSQEEIDDIRECLDTVELIILAKATNLSPEEKQFYGKLGNKTESWVGKVKEYMEKQPESVPFYIDKPEFDRDVQSRADIIPILERVNNLREALNDTIKLLSTDIYNAALAYYRHIKLSNQQNQKGMAEIYEDLTKEFSGRSSSVPEKKK